MSPVPYTWGPFSAKIFLKIWFCKIDPLLPPHIDFNTIPYFTYGCPYRGGVKEGKLKTQKKFFYCIRSDWRGPFFFSTLYSYLLDIPAYWTVPLPCRHGAEVKIPPRPLPRCLHLHQSTLSSFQSSPLYLIISFMMHIFSYRGEVFFYLDFMLSVNRTVA